MSEYQQGYTNTHTLTDTHINVFKDIYVCINECRYPYQLIKYYNLMPNNQNNLFSTNYCKTNNIDSSRNNNKNNNNSSYNNNTSRYNFNAIFVPPHNLLRDHVKKLNYFWGHCMYVFVCMCAGEDTD